MGLSLRELQKARDALQISLKLLSDSKQSDPNNTNLHRALRDSCIQRFEFCVELSWKVSLKVLRVADRAPGPAVREMASNGLIDDVQIWFDFLEARNKTSHTYDEDVAVSVFAVVEMAMPHFENLISRLMKK